MARRFDPNKWLSGPDPDRHKWHRLFQQAKNQAQWRKEIWLLDFEEWLTIFGDDIYNRGHGKDQSYMSRIDLDKAWQLDNCIVRYYVGAVKNR
jgi:hypothetical protein